MIRTLLVVAALALIACTDTKPSPAALTYFTPVDQQRTIELFDGSSVLLNVDTQVDVIYSTEKRLVNIVRGQAYFNVAEDPRPFQVQGGSVARIIVKENSTSAFETRIEPDRLIVSVERGSVVVSTYEQYQQKVSARQQLTIISGEKLGNVKILDDIVDSTWRDGWVEIIDTPLGEVIEQLNGYYNNKLRLKSGQEAELSALRVSARLYIPDIKKVIRTLARSMQLKISTEGDIITLYQLKEPEWTVNDQQ